MKYDLTKILIAIAVVLALYLLYLKNKTKSEMFRFKCANNNPACCAPTAVSANCSPANVGKATSSLNRSLLTGEPFRFRRNIGKNGCIGGKCGKDAETRACDGNKCGKSDKGMPFERAMNSRPKALPKEGFGF